jgi:CTP synthase
LPYIETLRQLIVEFGKEKIICVTLTYLPYIKVAEELKTKPTQHSVKQLQSMGVQPDIILCRIEKHLTDDIRAKLSMFCNVKKENVIEALDVDNIYLVPKLYHQCGLDKQICSHFNLWQEDKEAMAEKDFDAKWSPIEYSIENYNRVVRIGVVGKYTKLKDAYISLSQAIMHGGFANNVKTEIDWIDAEETALADFSAIEARLSNVSAIIVPGGFSARGIEGKLFAIKYARENNSPFLGICLGMQLAVIESCRNITKIDATSSEFAKEGEFVIDFMNSWTNNDNIEIRTKIDEKGGTMRLGSYSCKISPDTLAYKIYGTSIITERHRHRYEVNIKKYKSTFEKAGLIFSGMSIEGILPEIVERQDHPFFIATQAHPEFKSRPFAAHPLFSKIIKVAHKTL